MSAARQVNAFLIAGLVVAVASAGVFGTLAWRNASVPAGPAPRVQLADGPYASTAADAAVVKTDVWLAPSSQSKGRDWVYDTFTPPEIYYNARTKHFTVKPPANLIDEPVEEAFGLELVTVRPEPFRLQLIGFFGEGAAARGMFENIVSGEVFLATAGHRVAKLGLTIKGLDVQLAPIALAQSMTTRQRVATAVVLDEKTGREVTITHRARAYTGSLSAFVAA
ncbi:MAG: hypothetical protein RLZZ15_2921, partial [Verrucomicrobiota bacterium]